jgi:hypothetical protein
LTTLSPGYGGLCDRAGFIDEVREALRADLCDANGGKWFADYVRLRFAADKPRD